MKEFLLKNKVFIIGLALAILTTVYELISTDGHPSWWIIGWSVAIAGLTYAARNVRGQAASILGTIGMTAASFFQLHNQPNGLNMQQIMTSLVLPITIQILSLFYTSPTKPTEYERTPIIESAKAEAEQIKVDEKLIKEEEKNQ